MSVYVPIICTSMRLGFETQIQTHILVDKIVSLENIYSSVLLKYVLFFYSFNFIEPRVRDTI